MSGGNPARVVQADAIYTAADVAELLAHGVRWFRANRKRLHAEGFPPPVSCVGRPRWYGADILEWLKHGRSPAQSAQQDAPRSSDEWARVLADRANNMAAAAHDRAPVERIAPAPACKPALVDHTLNVARTDDLAERRAIVAKRLAMDARGLDPDNRNDVSLARNLGII